ncbi:MAG: glycyl-radical enzyme activating protein, partial [Actinobacteria bacterium]|nr:glycyl-radical enzyme activating protein [Actinomycetota bacterium]
MYINEYINKPIDSIFGIVFDIQRFCVNDGPGIRTTVFLKGCPLNCLWCHNPESISIEPEIIFSNEKCIGCGSCVAVCANNALQILERKSMIKRENCNKCGRCAEICNTGALRIAGKKTSLFEVMEELEKDRQYYENSGGGITISGGEPLLQWKFTTALLKECKKRGLYTAIETCGHAAPVIFKQVLEYADIILFDIKNIDPEKHFELTGARNELILENLKSLSGGNKHIQIQLPVIPGCNDSEENITGISEFLVKYGFKDVMLIPTPARN